MGTCVKSKTQVPLLEVLLWVCSDDQETAFSIPRHTPLPPLDKITTFVETCCLENGCSVSRESEQKLWIERPQTEHFPPCTHTGKPTASVLFTVSGPLTLGAGIAQIT